MGEGNVGLAKAALEVHDQAVQDLLAGHVTFTIEGLPLLKPFIDNGRLRVLAVTTPQRAKSMPDVPTLAEAGVPGYQLTA